MKFEKYIIKKGKTDLLTSLKALDKKIINKKMKELGINSLEELKDYIITSFDHCLSDTYDDKMTQMFFSRLVSNENSEWMVAYPQDIESLIVFVYKKGNNYSYYIPIEIKEIIYKYLGTMTKEEKFNLENAINTPIIKDLRSLLETLTVDDLKSIGNLLMLNRLSNVRKMNLIEIIYNALTDKETLIDIIGRFVDKEFKLLIDLMNHNGTIQDNNISVDSYHFLYMAGLVFIFKQGNKFYVSITDDVYNTIRKIDLKKIQKIVDENTKVYSLVRSMIELYGVVSYGDLGYHYSLYYGKGKDLDFPTNALYFCERLDNISTKHTKDNMYFIHKFLTYDNLELIFNDIIERQKIIKRKPIELKELLKYYDYDYYEETASKKEFEKYLRKHNIPSNVIEGIIKTLSNMYRFGYDFVGLSIEFLQENGVDIRESNLQEITNYLIEIYNNSRVWTNNGWTPREIRLNNKR